MEGHCIVGSTLLGGALYWEGYCIVGQCIVRGTVLGALYWEGHFIEGHCIRRGTVLRRELYCEEHCIGGTVLGGNCIGR